MATFSTICLDFNTVVSVSLAPPCNPSRKGAETEGDNCFFSCEIWRLSAELSKLPTHLVGVLVHGLSQVATSDGGPIRKVKGAALGGHTTVALRAQPFLSAKMPLQNKNARMMICYWKAGKGNLCLHRRIFGYKKGGTSDVGPIRKVKGASFRSQTTVAYRLQLHLSSVQASHLSVRYDIVNFHGHGAGAVKTNKNAHVKVSIGFTSESINMRRQSGIIGSYLLHYGYEDTLNSLYMATQIDVPPISMEQENGFDEQDILYVLSEKDPLPGF
ncbi:hypothetical protein SAY86_019906 [Trapa natans]|uniref:Uncharacterized protein n=1 Tax=Trapa natans TaxID=22666 RepID=A0AAN7LYH3_TRANT|nr:hypothetical protein SAY86_019906 [Trapa natans]